MAETRKCPFCNGDLTIFGKDVRGGKVVDTVIHGIDDSDTPCPLSLLVFRVDLWNTRPIEDGLRDENLRLREALNDALQLISEHRVLGAHATRVQAILERAGGWRKIVVE